MPHAFTSARSLMNSCTPTITYQNGLQVSVLRTVIASSTNAASVGRNRRPSVSVYSRSVSVMSGASSWVTPSPMHDQQEDAPEPGALRLRSAMTAPIAARTHVEERERRPVQVVARVREHRARPCARSSSTLPTVSGFGVSPTTRPRTMSSQSALPVELERRAARRSAG